MQFLDLVDVGSRRLLSQFDQSFQGVRKVDGISGIGWVVTSDRDALHDRKFGLASAQRASLNSIRLGDLLEPGVTEVSSKGLLGKAAIASKKLNSPFEFRRFFDSPLASLFEAVGTAIQIDHHFKLPLCSLSLAPSRHKADSFQQGWLSRRGFRPRNSTGSPGTASRRGRGAGTVGVSASAFGLWVARSGGRRWPKP